MLKENNKNIQFDRNIKRGKLKKNLDTINNKNRKLRDSYKM